MGRGYETNGGNTGSGGSSSNTGNGTVRGNTLYEMESQSQNYIAGERGSSPGGNVIGERENGPPRSDTNTPGSNLLSGIESLLSRIVNHIYPPDSPPDEPGEYLVMGAILKCNRGTEESPLIVTGSNTTINGLPQATVKDSVKGENILGFGTCQPSRGGMCLLNAIGG